MQADGLQPVRLLSFVRALRSRDLHQHQLPVFLLEERVVDQHFLNERSVCLHVEQPGARSEEGLGCSFGAASSLPHAGSCFRAHGALESPFLALMSQVK